MSLKSDFLLYAWIVACCILLIVCPDVSIALQPGALDDEPGMWRVIAHRETKVRRQHGSAEAVVGYDPSSWNPYQTREFATYNVWWENRFQARFDGPGEPPVPGEKVFFYERVDGELRNLGYGFVREHRRRRGQRIIDAAVSRFFYMNPYGEIRTAPSLGPGSQRSSWIGTLDPGKSPEESAFYMASILKGKVMERQLPGLDESRDILLTQLQKGNVREKTRAVDFLGAFPKQDAIEQGLLQSLRDRSVDVRLAAVFALYRYASSPAVQKQIPRLFGDAENVVRIAAAGVCATEGFALEAARDALIGPLVGWDWPTHQMAMRVWKRLPAEVARGGAKRLRAYSRNPKRLHEQLRAAHALASAGLDREEGLRTAIEATRHEDIAVRKRSISTMAAYGAAAQPRLMELLDDETWILRAWAATQLGLLGVRDTRTLHELWIAADFGHEVGDAAEDALYALGFTADTLLEHLIATFTQERDSLPRLVAALTGRRSSEVIALSLIAEGPPAVPLLADAFLNSGKVSLVHVLARMGTISIPALEKIMDSVPPDKLEGVLRTCHTLGPEAAPMTLRLTGYLGHPRDGIRMNAARLLGEIGPPAAEAVPRLVNLTTDPEVFVRQEAITTLGKLGKAAEPALPRLRAIIEARGPDWSWADSAYKEIQNAVHSAMDPGERIRKLTTQLASEDPRERLEAVTILEELGLRARDAFPFLVKATRDPDKDVRRVGAHALIALDQPDKTLPAIIALLEDPEPSIRSHIAYRLQLLGAAARPALPALRRLTKDRDKQVRKDASNAVKVISAQ